MKNVRKTLSVFSLVMINVIAVDSLRSLTVGAEYGLALIFFYLIAGLFFFVPTILVTAELATGWPNTGGVYIWVREAFGPRWGFLTIWLQWIYNVVWFPTIFAFVAGILAYLIDPELANNKVYMLGAILIAFWSVTLINCLGLKVASWVSIIGAIFGTMLPMIFITVLGGLWIYWGHPSQIQWSISALFPNLTHWQNIAFITNILFGLVGMEMSAVHAGDVQDPKRDYPKALLYSGIIIITTLIMACLAITIVIPVQQLSLVSGLMDAFAVFFHAFGMDGLMPVMTALIILGSISGAAAWIIGPARGLLISTEDNELPRFLSQMNRRQMPVGILLTQGLIVTVLCTVFWVMPSVNSSYWVLSNLTAQLALLFYILMFAAAIRLRYKCANIERSYRIPGGLLGMWLVAGVGILTCLAAILVGFIPPNQIAVGEIFFYEAILVLGMLIFCLPAFVLHSRGRNKS